MTYPTDLLAELADIDPASELARARATRDAATRHAQGSHDVLFGQDDDDFPLSERIALAAKVAEWHGQPALHSHYAHHAQPVSASPRSEAAQAFAHLLTFEPVAATPEAIGRLREAGWSERGVVTLAQLVAFVSFQSRLLAGLRLLQGNDADGRAPEATAGRWHTAPQTAEGKTAPVRFTREELGWEPWLTAKPLAAFSTDEQATLARFGHTDSDYFRLLGRNLPLLEQRTLTDKGIFYTTGGLPRAERELAATVASKVNGCIYCASVHARKAGQLSKNETAIENLLNVQPGASLSQHQSPRWTAVIALAASLSVTPPAPTQKQVSDLRAEGLETLDLLDLIQSAAFFAWANRLMLTLGEPFERG
ncbi:alkylhydroperoxidase domain protein [Erwinia oleae]|uniref:alkylhydroperoxidase domain protein n=1 Tax=Erwinia oleae TaxID=796334 RepID=UPI000553A658|nr:alkylhydroperoxidase domain protein [Erwinia oleae]